MTGLSVFLLSFFFFIFFFFFSFPLFFLFFHFLFHFSDIRSWLRNRMRWDRTTRLRSGWDGVPDGLSFTCIGRRTFAISTNFTPSPSGVHYTLGRQGREGGMAVFTRRRSMGRFVMESHGIVRGVRCLYVYYHHHCSSSMATPAHLVAAFFDL